MKADVVDKLFSEYYNEALLYTVSLCKNKTVAEDIVSTAFFKALSTADESVQNFKPWLLTVCRNEFINQCRKDKHLSNEEISEDMRDDREAIIEQVIRKEEYRSLYRAIDLLPQNLKETVTLFYFSGIPVRDIAQITGKSEINIKVQLCRAREKLRTIMEGEL